MDQHLPAHGAQHVLDSTGIVQYDDTPCDHARTLSLDGDTTIFFETHISMHSMHSPMNFGWLTSFGTYELNGTSLALFGWIRRLEHWNLKTSHCSCLL
jgi:hypothetical protein